MKPSGLVKNYAAISSQGRTDGRIAKGIWQTGMFVVGRKQSVPIGARMTAKDLFGTPGKID